MLLIIILSVLTSAPLNWTLLSQTVCVPTLLDGCYISILLCSRLIFQPLHVLIRSNKRHMELASSLFIPPFPSVRSSKMPTFVRACSGGISLSFLATSFSNNR